MQQPLITRADISLYRQISNTPHDAKLNEAILDAQMLDVQPLLGEVLFNKIMAAPEDYAEIMNPGEYQYQNNAYQNYGLKMVIVYYAYARYIMFGSAIDTPFSLTEKLNNDSRPVDASTKKSMYNINRDSAFQIWQNVKNYLVRTNQPDFNSGCSPKNTPHNGFRISKIG